MAHSGTWKGRMKMAWSSWILGALMIVSGGIGLFMGLSTGSLIMSGATMVGTIIAIVVAGKVADDRGTKK